MPQKATRVILMELAGGEDSRTMAKQLAESGDSIGLAWRSGETSEESVGAHQLELEGIGGISLAINVEGADEIRNALEKMVDFFGRVDAVVGASKEFAAGAAKAVAPLPSKKRPKIYWITSEPAEVPQEVTRIGSVKGMDQMD